MVVEIDFKVVFLPGRAYVFGYLSCGNLVIDQELHRQWHAENDKPIEEQVNE